MTTAPTSQYFLEAFDLGGSGIVISACHVASMESCTVVRDRSRKLACAGPKCPSSLRAMLKSMLSFPSLS